FGIKFNTVDPTVLPKDASARQAYDTVSSDFPPYRESPIWVSVKGVPPRATLPLEERIRHTEGVAAVYPPQQLGEGVTVIRAISETPSNSGASKDTVKRIRDLAAPPRATVLVGGATAEFIDFQSSLARPLPIAFGIIVVATLVILFLMTGSVILPVKSLIMN